MSHPGVLKRICDIDCKNSNIWMDTVYDLFKLSKTASPNEILDKCDEYCRRWTPKDVLQKLTEQMGPLQAAANAEMVFLEGERYLKTTAAMLLDPGARQCYDAWVGAMQSENDQKKKLTRSRLLWFNNNSAKVLFSEKMIDDLDLKRKGGVGPVVVKKSNKRFRVTPQCRSCSDDFDLSGDYLVLHCHCTTRVGHRKCMLQFSSDNKNKCPVCRQLLLKRHQISKYLFWNVKEKYKIIA